MFFVCLFLINAFTLQLNSWGVFTLSGLLLLDKPWSQVVSSLLPPGTCLQFFVAHRVQYSHCSSIFIEYTANSRFRSFIVRVLVRWVGGERLTHRLPYISLITLSPPWNGPDIRVDAQHQHALPISGYPEIFFRFLT